MAVPWVNPASVEMLLSWFAFMTGFLNSINYKARGLSRSNANCWPCTSFIICQVHQVKDFCLWNCLWLVHLSIHSSDHSCRSCLLLGGPQAPLYVTWDGWGLMEWFAVSTQIRGPARALQIWCQGGLHLPIHETNNCLLQERYWKSFCNFWDATHTIRVTSNDPVLEFHKEFHKRILRECVFRVPIQYCFYCEQSLMGPDPGSYVILFEVNPCA